MELARFKQPVSNDFLSRKIAQKEFLRDRWAEHRTCETCRFCDADGECDFPGDCNGPDAGKFSAWEPVAKAGNTVQRGNEKLCVTCKHHLPNMVVSCAKRHAIRPCYAYEDWEPFDTVTQTGDTVQKGNDLHGKDMQYAQKIIREVCSEIADFLIKKNNAYGNSAINPVRIFAKSDALEQINVRIDDKLNRFLHGGNYPGDNDEKDLVGYFVLKWVAKRIQAELED